MLPFCQFISKKAQVIVLSQILKDPGHDLTLLPLATITLTMDKVWIGPSEVKSFVQSREKIKTQSVKKACRDNEWCEPYRFYQKFKQYKFFIAHNAMCTMFLLLTPQGSPYLLPVLKSGWPQHTCACTETLESRSGTEAGRKNCTWRQFLPY